MSDELTPAFAISQAPNAQVKAHLMQQFGVTSFDLLTPAEKQEVETFGAEVFVQAQHLRAHGGEAAMAQKERVTASWLAGNVHTQGSTK